MMKTPMFVLIFIISINLFSQNKKEVLYLIFDNKNIEKCKIDVEQNHENRKGISFLKKYRKEHKRGRIIFNICDEKFIFNDKKQKRDTCTVKSLNKLNIKNIDYLKNQYEKGNFFKHQIFEQINIIEKVSNNRIVKYYNVYWSGEWVIE